MQIREAEKLPAFQIADEVNAKLSRFSSLVVTAPPGAGKSTLLPLTIYKAMVEQRLFGEAGGKIIVLEPRRLAARQIAERMASMLGEKVGETVGYRVRQDTKVSEKTRIEVITEGILTRMLVSDSTLDGISVVIFDEFHERSINSDVALTLTKEVQAIIRPDLKVVVMSATIETEQICSFLKAPLVESGGRMFPVEVINANEDIWNSHEDIVAVVGRTIAKAHREQEGDILVFLPGEAEIHRCQELLGDALSPTRVCPLYGMLSNSEQRLAIAPSAQGERKIVLATSIAETSITIEGVRVVVDSGLCRKMVFDARTGLSHLETVQVSLDMAKQRSGRAGRVAPGRCYRMWTKAAEHRMQESRIPEIEEADLSPMLLDIAAWGEATIESLDWLTVPPQPHVKQASALLKLLNAIDQQGVITAHGRKLWRYPYHPRIAQMLVKAEGTKLSELARRIAEMLESAPSSWPKHIDEAGAGSLFACAYPERIAMRLNDGFGQYRLAGGNTATVDNNDRLSAHKWIAIASMNAVGNGRVFLGAPLDDDDLEEYITEKDNLSWDNKQGMVVVQRERRIGVLLVDSKPMHNARQEDIVKTICDAAKKYGTSMFDFSDSVQNLQCRISTVAQWHPELELPETDTESVLDKAAEWLPVYIGKATTTTELRKIDLPTVIWNLLSYEQQQAVDKIAPSHLSLPSGRRIRVEYRLGAELPIVRVKLQECFGMTDTPRVDNGSRPVLMELLSPGFKPVQLTQDLRSFWSETYFEVRKELRRRYPKHAWPENPL